MQLMLIMGMVTSSKMPIPKKFKALTKTGFQRLTHIRRELLTPDCPYKKEMSCVPVECRFNWFSNSTEDSKSLRGSLAFPETGNQRIFAFIARSKAQEVQTKTMRLIPSPKALPVFGTMLSIMAAGGASKLHLYVDRRHKQLGPIYREKIGPVSGIFVADGNYMRKIFAAEGKHPRHIVPEAWLLYNRLYGCERGLLFMDGEEWSKYRKIMNSVMLKVRHDTFYGASEEVAQELVQNWREGGKITDLETCLYEWSLRAIVAVLLGCDNYSVNKGELSPAIKKLARTVHQIFIESAKLSLIPVKLAVKLNLPVWRRFVHAATSAVEDGKKLVERLLEIERRNPDKQSLLLEMVDKGVELEYLIRIATDLILAAGDTTAHTTQWLLHLLSTNLSTQSKIYDEIKNDTGKDANQSPLLRGALKEALRLYPVAPFITRFMSQDLILDEHHIKAEELVLMSLYSTGRNEIYFPKPDCFLPERWTKKDSKYAGVTNPTASLPFAMGSRSCVGRKLAETQILVTISKILRNFIVKSDQQKRLEITLHLIAVPSEPVNIILELRPRHPLE